MTRNEVARSGSRAGTARTLQIELIDAPDHPEAPPAAATPHHPAAALGKAAEGRPLALPIGEIRRDEQLICRAGGIQKPTVTEYAEAMAAGAPFPPVVVFVDGKGVHWLADGFHRTEAAALAGRSVIDAEVRRGGRREALLHAASANAAHGLRRTSADKRRAVVLVLASFPKWSDRRIGEACGVDHKTVSKLRPRPTGENPQLGREGLDGRVRARPAFDSARELWKLETSIGSTIDNWPSDDIEGLTRLGAMLSALAARLDSERRTPLEASLPRSAIHYVELCAGTAAVGLALLGAPDFPCSRFGSKRGYADAILKEMGLARGAMRGLGDTATFIEADDRVASVLEQLMNAPAQLSTTLRAVIDKHPSDDRALWQDIRSVRDPTSSLLWMAGARGGTGRWRGEHKLRPNAGGFSPNLSTLQRRVSAFEGWGEGSGVTRVVRPEDVSRVDPRAFPQSIVYIDPPYGGTRYRHELAVTPEVLAWSWAGAGHRVFMSFDRPLDDPRVRSVDVSSRRHGQERSNPTQEWLLCFPSNA